MKFLLNITEKNAAMHYSVKRLVLTSRKQKVWLFTANKALKRRFLLQFDHPQQIDLQNSVSCTTTIHYEICYWINGIPYENYNCHITRCETTKKSAVCPLCYTEKQHTFRTKYRHFDRTCNGHKQNNFQIQTFMCSIKKFDSDRFGWEKKKVNSIATNRV